MKLALNMRLAIAVFGIGNTLVLASCSHTAWQTEVEISPDWIDEFFSAYGQFDGSHLDYYSANVRLVDETAGVTMENKAQMEALFQQAKATYTALNWVIEDRYVESDRAVVRGRASGVAMGQDFNVAFTTWLYVADGKIVHQVDFVDYETMRKQLSIGMEEK